jgi:hypothetical protein
MKFRSYFYVFFVGWLFLAGPGLSAQNSPNPKLKVLKGHENEMLRLIKKNDKLGYAGNEWVLLIKPVFDEANLFEDHPYREGVYKVARVKYKGKWGVLRPDATFALDCEYDSLSEFNDRGVAIVEKDGLFGLVSASGVLLCPIQWADARIDDDVAWGKLQGKWSGFDDDGSVFAADCSSMPPVKLGDNVFRTYASDGKIGLMNRSGRTIAEPELDMAELEPDGKYIVVKQDDVYGCYTLAGKCYFSPASHAYPSDQLSFLHSSSEPLEWEENPFGAEIIAYDVMSDNQHVIKFSLPLKQISAGAFGGDESLKSITLPNGLLVIGNEAFKGCANLMDIRIPESVLEIGQSAFEQCHALQNLTIPIFVNKIGRYAFYGCREITSANIPSEVDIVEQGVFFDCDRMVSVIMPDGVRSIGGYAFYGCGSLERLKFPSQLHEIGEHAFEDCVKIAEVSIPYGDTLVGDAAFKGCLNLFRVEMPNSIRRIGESAFEGCSKLASIMLPNSFSEIADWTFHDCFALQRIVIPNSIVSIGSSAFSGCRNLKEVMIPNSVKDIGSWAFANCVTLERIDIPSSVISIGEYAFNKCTGLSVFTIPTSVERIGADAFTGTERFEKLKPGLAYMDNCLLGYKGVNLSGLLAIVPHTRVIADGAFKGCEKVTSVIFPLGLRRIGTSTFEGCSKLQSLSLPESVELIEGRAFKDCISLSRISIPKDAVVDERAFEGCGALVNILLSTR